MKKILITVSFLLLLLSIFALTGGAIEIISPIIEARIGRVPTSNTTKNVVSFGWILLGFSLLVFVFSLLVLPYISKLNDSIKEANRKLSDVIQQYFREYIYFGECPSKKSTPRKFRGLELTLIFTFVVFSGMFFLSIIQDYPNVKLASDAANITSFAAAYDHPELFIGDPILGDVDRFGIYQNIEIPLIRFFTRFTHNYPFSFMLLLPPTIFLFLLSFYLLGRVIFESSFWALIFTILNAIPLYLIIDSTGIRDPLPRVLFQSIFPFIIILLWKFREKPSKWFIVSISMGTLAYVHSVSTAPWAAGLLLGYIALMPKEWNIKQRFKSFMTQGLCMLIAMLPFVINFTGHQSQPEEINLALLRYIYENHFPQGLLDIPATVISFISITTANGLFPLSIIAFIVLYFLMRRNRQDLWMIALWCVGIFLVSIILPYTERIIERYLRIPPIEIELIRGIRHYIFIMILLVVWALSEINRRSKKAYIKYISFIIGILIILLVYSHRETRIRVIQPVLDCIKTGHLLCGKQSDLDSVLIFLKDETPIGSKIFFANNASDRVPLAVRYTSLRPLVYSDKDRGLIYTNPEFAEEWYDQYSKFSSHGEAKDWFQENPKEMVEFARSLGADYLVINSPDDYPTPDETFIDNVYSNNSFTIYRIIEKPPE